MTSSVLLLGDPISRSLSPEMQNAAFQALGIDCTFVLREVDHAGLGGAIAQLRRDERILGANVTTPHKEAVIPLLDDFDQLARTVGAVNTISRQGARLKGWNTDVEGFRRALAEQSPFPLMGKTAESPSPLVEKAAESPSPLVGEGRGGGYPTVPYRLVAIIGAGGAARAVAAALQPDADQLWVIARNLDQAQRLCRDLKIERGGPVDMNQMQETVARAQLVVNATPADLPLESWVGPGQRVFDLRYRRSGDGLAMLLYQGAIAFEIWTGHPAPLQVMRTTLERSAESVPA